MNGGRKPPALVGLGIGKVPILSFSSALPLGPKTAAIWPLES